MEIRNAFSGSESSHAGKQSAEDVLTRRWTGASLQVVGMSQPKGTGRASPTAHQTNLSLPFGPLPFSSEHRPVRRSQAADEMYILRSINSYRLPCVLKRHFTTVPYLIQKYHQVMKTPVQGFHAFNNIYQATIQTPWLPF